MTRVDAHHHLWDPSRAHYPWLTEELASIHRAFGPDDLRAATATGAIDATVLVQTRSSTSETEEFLATAAEDPLIAGVVGWVDLTAPAVSEEIDRLRDLPGGDRLVAIRHQVHDEADPDWIRRPDVRRGIAAAGATGRAYEVLVRTRELPAALEVIRELSEVMFVIDHLAKPPIREGSDALDRWRAALTPIAALPNVVAKVSGLITEAEWDRWSVADLVGPGRAAVELFGPDRLLFGSDWPVCLVAADYARVVQATTEALTRVGLSTDERAAVFGDNAIRTYGLEIRPR